MPFEAKAVKHPDTTMEDSDISRTAAAVAQEIQDLYNDVGDRGGTIVAEHQVFMGGNRAYGTADNSWTVFVADVPEQTKA